MRLMYSAIIFFLALLFTSTTQAAVLDDVTQTLKNGTPTFEMRWSFEVSDLNDGEKAKAVGLNVRTRIGYRTADLYDKFSAYIQLHNVTNLVENYRWPGGGDAGYDVIGDPDGSRVHQAYLDIKCPKHAGLVRIGKQEILFDDVRLIGNIGWRQNGQSFDAAKVSISPIKDVTFDAAYVSRVNTIFLTHFDLNGYWFHVTYAGLKNHKISLFAYLNDFEDNDYRDSATYGLRAFGKVPFQDNAALRYDFTIAYQTDFAEDGDPSSFITVGSETLEEHGAMMLNLFVATDLKLNLPYIQMGSFGFGYQMLEGAHGKDKPFDTLFSTAHKWNGWADQFLATNGGTLWNGLEDYWVEAAVKFAGVKFKAVYHYFDTETKVDGLYNNYDGKYGQEFDLLLVKPFNKNITGLIKAAFFDADNDAEANGVPVEDETVFWTRLTIKF